MSAIKVIPLDCVFGTEVRMSQSQCIAMLEQYGRECLEAAEARCDAAIDHGRDAYVCKKYIHIMPLP